MKKLMILIMSTLLLMACNKSNIPSDAIIDQIISCIDQGDASQLKGLIKNRDLNQYTKDSISLLSYSVGKENPDIIEILLKHGANPNLINKDDYLSTPLMYCTNYNNSIDVQLLINYGADVNIVDKNGDPAINWAAYYGQVEITKILLENGAKTNLKSIHSSNTLMVAMKEWKEEVVNLLVETGHGTRSLNELEKKTISFVNKNQLSELQALGSSINTNLLNETNTNILSIASKNGYLNMVEFLVNNGADVNALNPVGHTALTNATRYGHLEIVEFLLKNGADVERSNEFYNYTPLMAAAVGNKPIAGELLIQNGANINSTDSTNNFTPVTWAVINNNVEFIKMIVKYNPDLNLVSKYGFKAGDIASEEIKEILSSN